MSIPQITMNDLYKRLQNLSSGELILDVRTQDEYCSGHVPGSTNIPLDQISARATELRNYKTIYIHCQAGGRAGKASSLLHQLGFNNLVCVSASGMGDWIAAGYPVER